MKRKFSFTVALWWIILCAIAGIFLIAATNKHSRLSETENRMLVPFPEANAQTLASGAFMSGFEDFLSDAFFARDSVVQLTDGLLERFSLLSEDEKLAYQARDMERRMASEGINPATDPQAGASAPEDGAEAAGGFDAVPQSAFGDASDASGAAPEGLQTASETADGGQSAPEAVSGETAAEVSALAGALPSAGEVTDDAGDTADEAPDGDGMDETDEEEGGELDASLGRVPVTATNSYMWLEKANGRLEKIYTFSNRDIGTFAETLRRIRAYLPADGQVLYTQVPLASIGNRWAHAQRSVVGWGSSCELVLEKYLEGEDDILIFNCMQIMEPYMAAGAKLFYETDHHWTAEGAYVVAAEMFRRQGLPVIPYDEYAYISNRGQKLRGYQDTFNFLLPLLPGNSYIVSKLRDYVEIPLMNYASHSYLGFMNNTRYPWRRIITGANTGRRALVICDSFGNAFAPYLLPYYDEVHMVDPRSEYHRRGNPGGSIGKLIQYHEIDDVYIVLSTANGLRKKNSLIYLREYLEDW